MPFFMVNLSNNSKCVMVKADDTDELIEKAVAKMKLPDDNYKVIYTLTLCKVLN